MKEKELKALYSWIEHMEKMIAAHQVIVPDIEKNKPGRVGKGWIWEIVRDVTNLHNRHDDGVSDACIGQAFFIGEVFLFWALRVTMSKIYDKRRSRKARLRMYAGFLKRCEIILAMLNPAPNEHDKKVFHPHWESPLEEKGGTS